MARLCVVIAIVLAPCPVLRATPTPATVERLAHVEAPPRASVWSLIPRPSQVPKRATAVTGRVAVAKVTRTVPSSHPPRRPLRATRSTLSHQKPVRRARTAADFPHTHSGLLAFAASLPYPWGRIIRCESAADDSWPVTSRSRARGILQFLRSTWRSLGLSGDPASYSWRYQFRQALRLRDRDGIGAWDCARLLGIS